MKNGLSENEGVRANKGLRVNEGLVDGNGGGGKDDEGEWQLVQSRRRRVSGGFRGRIDIAGNAEQNNRETVSFYFSDFPNSHGAKDMLKAFALYGRVVEVVIPPKKNKWGKRFCFVRFAEVQDPRVFAVKLDNIIFGYDKIHVNISRFVRGKQPEYERKNLVAAALEKPKWAVAHKGEAARAQKGSHLIWKEVKRHDEGGHMQGDKPFQKTTTATGGKEETAGMERTSKELKGGHRDDNSRSKRLCTIGRKISVTFCIMPRRRS